MIKKVLLIILIIFLLSTFLYIWYTAKIIDEYYTSNTFSIAESKKEGVFISEYRPLENNINVGNTIIKPNDVEIWTENSFHYKNKYHKIEMMKTIQLVINFKQKKSNVQLEFIDDNWSIDDWWAENYDNYLKYYFKDTVKSHTNDTIKVNFHSGKDTIKVDFVKI